MSQLLQISLGTVPAIIVLVVAAVINRRALLLKIIAMVLLASVAITGGVLHISNSQETASVSRSDAEKSVEMVYAMMATGDTQAAMDLLEDLMASTMYVEEYTLCNARLQAVTGNYTAAKLLYEKAIAAGMDSQDLQAEYDLAQRCLNANNLDLVLLQQNSNYAAGIENLDAILADNRQAKEQIVETVNLAVQTRAEENPELLAEAAAAVLEADTIYELYLEDQPFDEEQAAAIIKKLNAVEKKYPELFAQPSLRIARLKMRLATGDFEALAKDVNETSDYRELMVVSELYLNGYITKKDFSKTYGRDNLQMYKDILAQLKEIYSTHYINESAAQRNKVKDYIDQLEYLVENPAIAQLQSDLQSYADSYNASDSSKVYLQLSSLAQDQGNDTAADNHLASALNAVGSCTDPDYTGPMYDLIGAMNDRENTEGLKNVNQYVEQILDNSTTLPMHGSILIPREEEEEEEEEKKFDFATYFADYVSKKRTSINIINMNTESFPEVVVEVSIDGGIASTAERLKSILKVEDCGENIPSFKVEDITNNHTNIILVCDVSGSMDGSPISSLRSAVSRFIADKTDKENIGIVTFSSGVEAVYGLNSTVEELNAAVSNMDASGGTDMYSAVLHAISMLEYDPEAANVIILMSDGYDNYSVSHSTIQNNVCQPCKDKGIVLYSIGLGNDVDSSYLNSFAAGTGGSYLYVSDDLTLETFYEYLHNLLANRYRITYTATDETYAQRFSKLSLRTDSLAYDLGYYYIDIQQEEEELKDKYVHGLDVRQLYKSKDKKDQTVNLLVSNFEEDDVVSVSISGKQSYNLSCRRISDSKYELTIPANIAVGIYDMHVTVNGYVASFTEELLIAAEDVKTVFGPYAFTCSLAEQNEETITMYGNVCLNGWLYFNGTVTLTGDLENDYSIVLSEFAGSSIYYNAGTATGLAKWIGEKGFDVPVGMLGYVTLYNDKDHEPTSSDYKVVPTDITQLSLYQMILTEPCLSLYPYHLSLDIGEFMTNFENQGKIMTSGAGMKLFTFEFDGSVILTSQSIDFTATIGANQNEKMDYCAGTVGKTPVKFSKTNIEVSIDTLEDDYSLTFKTQLSFLKADGLGFKLKWGESFKMKEVRFYYDRELSVKFGSVPVSFSDFQLAVKDIDKSNNPLDWTFSGQTDIGVADVSSVLPKLEKYVGDVEFVTLDDTTLTFSLKEKYILLKADVKVMKELDVATVTIQCGKINYNNSLLGFDGTDIGGIITTVERTLEWKSDRCDISLSGTAQFVLSDTVIGISLNSSASIEVKWWVFSKTAALDGKSFVGVYIAEDNDVIFTVRATGEINGKKKGINVMWSSKHGGETDTKFY